MARTCFFNGTGGGSTEKQCLQQCFTKLQRLQYQCESHLQQPFFTTHVSFRVLSGVSLENLAAVSSWLSFSQHSHPYSNLISRQLQRRIPKMDDRWMKMDELDVGVEISTVQRYTRLSEQYSGYFCEQGSAGEQVMKRLDCARH